MFFVIVKILIKVIEYSILNLQDDKKILKTLKRKFLKYACSANNKFFIIFMFFSILDFMFKNFNIIILKTQSSTSFKKSNSFLL